MTIEAQPIAFVRSPFVDGGPHIRRQEIVADIVVREDLTAALAGIEEWSHLFVLFWMHQRLGASSLTTHPRNRAELPEVGVLAARGRDRPNPIGLAVVELLERRDNVLKVRRLDAWDGSPVLDIKPYDGYDVIQDLRTPQWWTSLTAS